MRCSNALRSSFVAFALAVTAATSQAQSYSATTTAGAIWNRPVSCATLSGVGTTVRYHAQAVYATTTGTYNFTSTATGVWDNFLALYSPTFSAAAPLTNCKIVNDDGPGGIGTSAFSFLMAANTQFWLITTGFDTPDFGAFTNTVSGPSAVVFGTVPTGTVPEPSTYALMLTGVVGLVGITRRRKTR